MARRRHKSNDEEISYWLSYSDMMAALLLIFVLIISFTILQSKHQYETKEKELVEQQLLIQEQQEKLDEQAEILNKKQNEIEQAMLIEAQQKQLEEQQEKLVKQEDQLKIQQAEMEEQQDKLEEQETQLKIQQIEIEEQQEKLAGQENQLKTQQIEMEEQQEKLAEQEDLLRNQQIEMKEQQEKLTEQENQLEIQQIEMEEQQVKLQVQEEKMQTQQEQLDKIIGVRSDLVSALKKEFDGSELKVSVDSQTGAIMLDSSVLFDFGKYELKNDGKKFLEEFLPRYLGVLLNEEYQTYISEIIIEGHTDTVGSYMYNLELSQERALAVAKFSLDENNKFMENINVMELQNIVTANGRSFSDLIYNEDGTVNMDSSRRVEFKFRLKDEEMIQEMSEIFASNKEIMEKE